jgi:hypothetical protein
VCSGSGHLDGRSMVQRRGRGFGTKNPKPSHYGSVLGLGMGCRLDLGFCGVIRPHCCNLRDWELG